jgi:membrane fusion protein, copper/silver efflux system
VNRAPLALAVLTWFVSCEGRCQHAPDHVHGPAPSATLPSVTTAPAAPSATASQSARIAPRPDPHAAHAPAASSAVRPPPLADYGHVALEGLPLSEIGFASAKVEKRKLTRQVRTTGWVTVDETRTSHVHAKVRGYVVSSHQSFVGRSVKRGEPLVSLYSEGIYAAELELLAIVQQQVAMNEALPGSPAAKSLDAVVEASRKRFSLWDVPKGQIDRTEKTGKPSKGVTLGAPRDGVILARSAIEGAYVEPATDLFIISDVSRLWVVFDLFESDMGHVALGQEVTLECEGLDAPHREKVAFLSPIVDPATRSLRARVSIDNRGGRLRPGAFSTVTLDIPIEEGPTLPEDAVIRTGRRDLVFVIDGDMAVPTEVTLGPKARGFYRVDGGVKEGDVVATGALFLLDAESRLRAASGGMGGHQHGGH